MSSFEEYCKINIALQVRKYRIENGYTQEELSDLLGKNLKYIGHIERCERTMSSKTSMQFMELLKIQPSEFYAFKHNYNWDEKE